MKNTKDHKILVMAQKAKASALAMSLLKSADKNKALKEIVKALNANADFIVKENQKDLRLAEKNQYSKALIDRLRLDQKRIQGMCQCILDTIKINDPVGEVISSFKRPNGLNIHKVRTPIGVVGIIYESRPNVTSDCIGLCLKSGNTVILKGGKEAYFSNLAIFTVIKNALKNTHIPEDAIQLIESTDREAVSKLLQLDKYVDVIIPRGGEGLIEFVAENSRIPVIKHYKGVCHTYVSDRADLAMAKSICFNAKVQRPGVCNAMETMLVHEKIAGKFLPGMISELRNAGVEIRGCQKTRKIVSKDVQVASAADWDEEYLDLILSVKVVKDLNEAVIHINQHGSHHSDAIITENKKEAEQFLAAIDSATVYVNASTRFTDGYEFGFGAEVGISTDKLHARGPMALEELTTYKYQIHGSGQIRL